MTAYTYTIFDNEPIYYVWPKPILEPGSGAWPTHQHVPIEAPDVNHALRWAFDEAIARGVASDRYERGHRLWVIVYDEAGDMVNKGCIPVV